MYGKVLAIILLCVSLVYSNDSTLAPHPISFAPMGEPTSIQIDIGGVWYEVNWDGASLDLEYGKPPPYDSEPPGNGDHRDKDPFDWAGFWFIIIGSIIFGALMCWAIIYFS